ncbi:MAG TPA: GWxTD domain-containing protein [Rubricoccaceae bacterium]|jgi:GWxTD domain-containing protein
MPRLASALAPLALAAALAVPAFAQSRPVQIRMDTGTFRYSDDASLAEVYLSVGASSLRYTRGASGAFEATVPLHLTIRPVADAAPSGAASAAAYDQTIDFRFTVADTTTLTAGQVFTEQVRTSLAPGEYDVAAVVPASAGSSSVEARTSLTVPDYGGAEGAALSSIQLARRIVRATDPSNPFVKSGRVVQPYPDAFYGGDLSRVTYYAEVYGVPADAGTYTVLAFLSNSSRPTPIEGTQTRTERPVQPVDILVGAIDVSTLPTGQYTLHLAVLNAANEAVAERAKGLFVINPDVPQPENVVVESTDDELLYAAMGEEELALNIEHARVVATSRERSDLASLRTDEERRTYLVRFWRNRSAAAGSTTDARRTFYDRLTRVNTTYRYGGSPGYRTDRGRIYLTYGAPSGVDRQTFNSDTAPFEVWTYENIPGEGLSEFVFVDRNNSGELTLVHSTVTGEISLPQWRSEITNGR